MTAPCLTTDRATAELAPKSLADFRNIHNNEAITVCGCGASLNELTDPQATITIGVNDVSRRFHPDYLVIVNPAAQFAPDRLEYIKTTQARFVFSQYSDLPVPCEKRILFSLGVYNGTDFSRPDVLHYTQNSPYVAICLAIHMGAKRIGLIGVDFTDHHFFGATGRHPLTHQLAQIDREYSKLADVCAARGVKIVNLSAQSRLTAFAKGTRGSLASAPRPERLSDDALPPKRVFFVNYRFLAAGDVFSQGLQHAADELGLENDGCYWDDGALPAKVRRFAPDLLLVVHGRWFVQRYPTALGDFPTAVWLTEEPYEVDETSSWSGRFRTVFVNDSATVGSHRNAHYLPAAYDPCRHFPVDGAERSHAVGFVGAYNVIRETALLRLLDAGMLSYVVGGPWRNSGLQRICLARNLPPAAIADLYRQTRIVLNVFRDRHDFNRAGIVAHSLNPRIYEAIACGAAVVSERRLEAQTQFPALPLFDTIEEMVGHVRSLLADNVACANVLSRCRADITKHTYAQRLRQALRVALPSFQRERERPRVMAPQHALGASSTATPVVAHAEPPPPDWCFVGNSISSIEDGQISLASINRSEPGSECGLASAEAFGDVTLAFELQISRDTWFIAKLHQQHQIDQTANSYHLVWDGVCAYLAMHHRVLQPLAFPARQGFSDIELSWRHNILKVAVDGRVLARIPNTELATGYCFLGLKSGRVTLRSIRLEGVSIGTSVPAATLLAEEWTPVAGDFCVTAGQVVLGTTCGEEARCGAIASEHVFTEVELGFDLLLGEGASFVAALHQQDRLDASSNSYHVVCHSAGVYLAKHHRVLAVLDCLSPGWHRLRLRRVEQRVEVSIDGQVSASILDTQLQSGFCRLSVEGGSANIRDLGLKSLNGMEQTARTDTDLHNQPTRAKAQTQFSLSPLPFTAMPRRNLLYHVWPVHGSIWQWNIEQLKRRIDLFNGRRLIAIMQDTKSEPADTVVNLLDGHGCEFLVRQNDPHGEAVTFPEMLEQVRSVDENEVTFYGHAKGVKYGADVTPAVRRWAEVLYRVSLDDWRSVWAQLQRTACTGAFRMLGRFQAHHNLGDWHYGGTFFWIRHAQVFGRGELEVPAFYGGVEAWLGIHFKQEETGCLFLDELRQLPYHDRFWQELANPAYSRWESSLRSFSPPPDLREPLPFCGFEWPRLEQRPQEMAWVLAQLLAALPRRLLTIGARHGGFEWHVARVFHQHGHRIDITTIELAPEQELHETFSDARNRFSQTLNVIQADSSNAAARTALGDVGFDAAFIDGDHSYRGAKSGWLLAKSLGARLIAFHDIADSHWHAAAGCCVSRLWAEIKCEHRTDEHVSGDWGGIGVVYL
jgi:hypothetical protein